MAKIDISLIICTRNRSRQLVRCLEAVGRIAFERPWELIIVDNGSVDDTAGVVKAFVRTTSIPVHRIFEPKAGLGNARNAGVAAATGKILAFTDDDCYPAPDFLAQVWAAFDDPAVGYIGGRILLYDPADHPITINESTIPRTFPARSFICSGSVQGANMAFRRAVLLDMRGFDPLFGAGALFPAEEDDAVGRASAAGWKGQYCPQVVVSHHHGRKAVDAPAVWRSYAIGRGAYHMKLLLRGHELLWFAQSVYQLRWRYRTSRGTVFWELVGALKYAHIYLLEIFRGWVGGLRRRVQKSAEPT